jgi:transposase InsO family protein
VIRLPPRSPNVNAYAERFVRSIKEECLDRMIFVGQASLRRAIGEYASHYCTERNHQGIENRLQAEWENSSPVSRNSGFLHSLGQQQSVALISVDAIVQGRLRVS